MYILVAAAAVGIPLPASDFQLWAQFGGSCWGFISEQAGSFQGFQRQSQGPSPQEEAVDTVQLRGRSQGPKQCRKTKWNKAVRRYPYDEDISTKDTLTVSMTKCLQFPQELDSVCWTWCCLTCLQTELICSQGCCWLDTLERWYRYSTKNVEGKKYF